MILDRYIDHLGELRTDILSDECTEHTHDYANYEIVREGNLVIGTCAECGKEFVMDEIEEEDEA